MRTQGIRLFATITGITDENLRQLLVKFPLDEAELEGRTLYISHDAAYFFIEDFMDHLEQLLDSDATGQVDLYDYGDWTLTRHRVGPEGLAVKVVNLNDVLERYSRE